MFRKLLLFVFVSAAGGVDPRYGPDSARKVLAKHMPELSLPMQHALFSMDGLDLSSRSSSPDTRRSESLYSESSTRPPVLKDTPGERAVTSNTFLPPFQEFFEIGQLFSVDAIVEGASLRLLDFNPDSGRVELDSHVTGENMAEIKFYAACLELLKSGQANQEGLQISGTVEGRGEANTRYEQCLHQYCADHDQSYGHRSSCLLAMNGVSGTCQYSGRPCECDDSNIPRPTTTTVRVQGQVFIRKAHHHRMRNQICLAELSALVFNQRALMGSKRSKISISLPRESSSVLPAGLSRSFGLELKLSTNKLMRKQFGEQFFKPLGGVLGREFFVAMERYSESADGMSALFAQMSVPANEIEALYPQAQLTEEDLYLVKALVSNSGKYNQLLTALKQRRQRSMSSEDAGNIRGAIVLFLRLDLGKILDQLTAMLEVGMKSKSLNLLSCYRFLVNYLVKELNLKNYIYELKLHHRQANRLNNLKKDFQQAYTPSAGSLRAWEDECRAAAALSGQNLKLELGAKLSARAIWLAELRGEVETLIEQGRVPDWNAEIPDSLFLTDYELQKMTPGLESFQKSIADAQFSLTPFSELCPEPMDVIFRGREDQLDSEKERCLACIANAEKVLAKGHRNGLQADWGALMHFSKTVKAADQRFKDLSKNEMAAFVNAINDQVEVTTGGHSSPLIQMFKVVPSTAEVREYDGENDEFYGRAILNTPAAEFSAFLLEGLLAGSAKYVSNNAAVESKGFLREEDSEMCLVNFGLYTGRVCKDGEPAKITVRGFVGTLEEYLRINLLEWVREQGFMLDDEEIDEQSLRFLFPSTEDSRIIMVDCETSVDMKDEDVRNELNRLAKLTPPEPLSEPPSDDLRHILTREDVSGATSCDNLCHRRAVDNGVVSREVKAFCDFTNAPTLDQAYCATEMPTADFDVSRLGYCNPLADPNSLDRCYYGNPMKPFGVPKYRGDGLYPGQNFLEELGGSGGPVHALSSQFLGGLFPKNPVKARELLRQGKAIAWINKLGGLDCGQFREFVGAALAEAANAPTQEVTIDVSIGVNDGHMMNSLEASTARMKAFTDGLKQAVQGSMQRYMVHVVYSAEKEDPDMSDSSEVARRWTDVSFPAVQMSQAEGELKLKLSVKAELHANIEEAYEDGWEITTVDARSVVPELKEDIAGFFATVEGLGEIFKDPSQADLSVQVQSSMKGFDRISSLRSRATPAVLESPNVIINNQAPEGSGKGLGLSLVGPLVALLAAAVL